MIVANNSEYRQLELDSSNLLMDWDADWGLGRFEQSTYAVLQAGEMRRRMGQMSFEAGEFCFAAQDWLSSVECFVAATALDQAEVSLGFARRLVEGGHIPPERKDLSAAMDERTAEIERLHQQIRDFNSWV